MAVSTVATKILYNGDGATVAFDIPQPFAAAADIEIWHRPTANDNAVKLALNTDYAVTGGGGAPYKVDFTGLMGAPAAGAVIAIARREDALQTTPFRDQTKFPAAATAAMGDALARAIQDVADQLNLTFQLPPTEAGPLTLPPPGVRDGNILVFENGGIALVSRVNVDTVAANMQAILDLSQPSVIAGIQSLSPADVVAGVAALKDLGAELSRLGAVSVVSAMVNIDAAGVSKFTDLHAELSKLVAVHGSLAQIVEVQGSLTLVNTVGADLALGGASLIAQAPGAAVAALAARDASIAARDLAEAWAAQPVDEDVAGASPGDRSALHQATRAGNSALEALTAEIASKTYQLGAKANVSAAATDVAAVAGRSIFYDLSDNKTKLLTSISPAAADPLGNVTSAQLAQLENSNLDTLAALIARTDADLIAGSTVSIKYGSAFGGYGDADFYVLSGSAASNGLTADGVVVLQNTEGGRTLVRKRWKDEGKIDLLWYTPAMDGASVSSTALTNFFTRVNALAAAQGRIHGIIPDIGAPFLSAVTQVIGSGVRLTGGGVLKAHSTLAMPAALLQTASLAGTTNVYEQSDIVLEDIIFDGGNNAFTYANRRALVRMFSVDGLDVRRCKFTDHDYILLSIGGCRAPTIEDSVFEGWGFPTQQNDGGSALWTAENPDVTDATETTQLNVSDNIFKNGEWSAMQILNSGGEVAYNRIYNVKEAGVYAQDDGTSNSERLTIARNRIDGVTLKDVQAAGLELSSAGMLVEGNWILNCVGPGIDLTGNSKDVLVKNNTLAGNAAGNATLDTTFGSSNYGELTIRLNPTGPVIPENVIIEDNNIGLQNISATADYAISIMRAPASGSDAIDGLKVRDNDCQDGYTVGAVFVASGILGTGSQVIGNEGDISRSAEVMKDQLVVRPDSNLEAVVSIDQAGAQNAVLELLTATVKRYRLFINSSGRLFERLFDGSGSILSGLTYREVDQTTGQTNWRFGHVFEKVVTFQDQVNANDVIVAGGLYRWEGSINDDAFASIPWAGGVNFSGKVLVITQDNTRRSTEFLIHGAGPTITDLSTAGITLLTSATDLTGTAGVDGAITVSLNAAKDAIHIENRLGGVRTFNISVLGS